MIAAVAQNADATVQNISEVVGISTRSAVKILNDLERSSYLEREHGAQRNH
ncbi:MarR family transcriptional regulator [Herbiconiux sp. VKM Ac-1786]|uniref:helix-turn-helix domain-containing protein n=1 Tax=Herbiconiux sp. VKM Ac-1786 TaxID=2783824 RepID=UPI00188C8665|nr:helix-turn-helix domain-containing protein [Herbiconiux sp. VKM Ac-1786]MBF4571920.1 MarR family transcriptional regulator [Herbiconiux sp. VKM Ac-1786]